MEGMSDDVIVAKPVGADFSRDLPDGRKVWFKDFGQGQRLMLVRFHELARAERRRIEESSMSEEKKYDALTALQLKADKRMWDAIDSRVVNPDDIEAIMDAMIAGTIDEEWARKVFAGNRDIPADVDDDVEVLPVAKKVAPAKKAAMVKKAANAKRTQVR